MLYSIANKSGLRREIKNIKNIWGKYSKKGRDSSSDSSSDNSDSDPSIANDSSWDKYRHPTGNKETNKVDHVVTNNLKTTKDQLNKSINNQLTFDTNRFNLCCGTIDPLQVVTVSLVVETK